MAASEDGEDCAMKYLKEQQKNPSGPRKTKPRCESDAAMEYLKGQLAKQKKTATGRTSPKVPLPDYLKGIRLQAPQTERSPEPSTRTASNPNSPGKIEAPQVRDAYFSPGSDVRKTLDLMQKVGAAPPAPPSHGPLSPGGPGGSVGPGPGVTRSASAKRIRPQAAASPTQCSQCSQCSPPSPLSWTTRSLRVPVQSAPCPSSPPGRSVPSAFRELELEAKEETVAAVASPPASWVKTYTDILEKSQKSQGGPGVRAARLESPVRRVVPGGAVSKNFQSGLVSPMQTWRSGRPPPPPPPATVVGSVPIDLVSLTSGSLRLPPGEEANPGYHSARIRIPEATEVAKQETTETAETRDEVVDTKSAKDEKSGNEDSQVAMKVDSQENAHPKDLEISPPPRAALTPCNFTGASTPNPSPKKPWEGTEIKSEKTLEKTPEQTHENRPPCEKPDLRSQPRLVPSGAWSPAPGFFRVHRDCMKPVQHTVAETTSTTSAGSGTGRIQGISTCITPSVMPCSTPPMPMTPPLPWHRVTGFELKPGQPGQTGQTGQTCLTREHTAASASARSAMATSTPMTSATTQWLPPKVGVYRTYSVTAAVPWFPKTEQRPWNPQQGSPLRRRQIKV